jgi:lipopolysaccharide export LptBFGC system permease protein LptF
VADFRGVIVAKRPSQEERLRLVFAYTVLIAWVVSFILDAAVKAYDPPAFVGPLALAVAGYLFGAPVARGLLERRTPDREEEK